MRHVCPECGHPVEPAGFDAIFALRPVQPEWVGDTEYVDGLGDYLHAECLQRSARPWRLIGRPAAVPALR